MKTPQTGGGWDWDGEDEKHTQSANTRAATGRPAGEERPNREHALCSPVVFHRKDRKAAILAQAGKKFLHVHRRGQLGAPCLAWQTLTFDLDRGAPWSSPEDPTSPRLRHKALKRKIKRRHPSITPLDSQPGSLLKIWHLHSASAPSTEPAAHARGRRRAGTRKGAHNIYSFAWSVKFLSSSPGSACLGRGGGGGGRECSEGAALVNASARER